MHTDITTAFAKIIANAENWVEHTDMGCRSQARFNARGITEGWELLEYRRRCFFHNHR